MFPSAVLHLPELRNRQECAAGLTGEYFLGLSTNLVGEEQTVVGQRLGDAEADEALLLFRLLLHLRTKQDIHCYSYQKLVVTAAGKRSSCFSASFICPCN